MKIKIFLDDGFDFYLDVKFHLIQFQVNKFFIYISEKNSFVLVLWTIIFCHDEFFGFVDYFFLALLIKIGQLCILKYLIEIKKRKSFLLLLLVDKHGVSEYSFCLQYLMQPNVLSDVESIIQKALSLERVSRQHLISSCDAQYTRVTTKDFPKPISPLSNYSRNPLIDSMRSNSSASISSSSKFASTEALKEKEMTV